MTSTDEKGYPLCRGCSGTCCTGVGSDPCTCDPWSDPRELIAEDAIAVDEDLLLDTEVERGSQDDGDPDGSWTDLAEREERGEFDGAISDRSR